MRRRRGETEYEPYKMCNIPSSCECMRKPPPKSDLEKTKDWKTNNTILDDMDVHTDDSWRTEN